VSSWGQSRRQALLLAAVCGFLFFYGLGVFGLVGADEPRYAQVAREMLDRGDWITPTLGGSPWLEKPVLYYWEAIIAYKLFGVSDWSARLPSAISATLLVITIFLFLRRFRPGSETDGAVMAASSAAMIGFSRAAAMDMSLAANFSIALLGWYAWHESGERRWLLAGYVFLALATLAKGPVALGLAGAILLVYAGLRRDWTLIARSLWGPGLLVYFAVALPWFLAVGARNPEFFRVFILEHNFARFGTNLYRHHQPFWYYLPVTLLGLLPWVALVVAAVIETIRGWATDPRAIFESEDAWDVFLLLWFAIPILFFSISQSKLPGYTLPALPAATLLAANYIKRRASIDERLSASVALPHSVLAASLIVPAVLIQYVLKIHHLVWGAATIVVIVVACLFAALLFLALRSRAGLHLVHVVTILPLVLATSAVLRFGGGTIDASASTRPLAASLAETSGTLPVAVLRVPRQIEYGLHFYRNHPVSRYERGEIPREAHLLVASDAARPEVLRILGPRQAYYLGNDPDLHVDKFRVDPAAQ
jgi:4-amino-4-deoxy-L-arabinose transferase-like glycosyltransferase